MERSFVNHKFDLPSVATVDALPNRPGASLQSSLISAGARCHVTGRGKTFVCTSPAVGSARWVGEDGELFRFDSARGLTQLLSGGTPDIQTGTWGTVAHKLGVAYAAPAAGDTISIVTDALPLFNVVFAGTEATPQLCAAAINAAAGANIATWDPYNPATGLIVGSRIAGGASTITLANVVNAPLAAIFGGGYAGSTINGVTAAPTISIGATPDGQPTLRMQANGAGALSSVAWFMKDLFALQDFEMMSSFTPGNFTTTWLPGISMHFFGDPVKGTAYSLAFLPTNDGVNPSDCGMYLTRNDGVALHSSLLGVASFAYLANLSVRGAAAPNYPKFTAQISGVGYTTPAFIAPAATSDVSFPYAAPWTTGSPPYPTNDHAGLGLFSIGTPFYFPIDVHFASLIFRRP